MKKVKSFLEENKDIINVVSSILLSAMAIIVSVKSCEISDRQYDLSQLAYQPIFKVDLEYEYDQSKRVFSREHLIIENLGYPIFDFNAKHNAFFKLSYNNGKEDTEKVQAINGYLDVSLISGNRTGVLLTMRPDNDNNSLMSDLEYAIVMTSSASKHPERYSLKLVNIVTIWYTDALGNKNTKYYNIPSVGAGEEMTKAQADYYLKDLDTFDMLEFNELDSAKVMQLMK